MNDKDSPVDLTDDMKASSQRRFVMKSETEVDETATKRKNTGSKISAYMEQKLDKEKPITSSYNAVAGPNLG